MLEIPEEIKAIYRKDNISKESAPKQRLRFYNDEVDVLYPYETLWPDENLFPGEHEGEPWLTIENDRIDSDTLQLTESLSSSDDMEFGSCEASMLEVTVADVTEDVTDKEFTLTVEVGGYEMAMGIYRVQSFVRQADRRKRKITAYDRMVKFDTDVADWYNGLTFPTTIRKMRDSLCEYVGVPQAGQTLLFDDLEITKTIEPEQISGRDVLQAICQINGCFGHIDKMGELTYIMLQQTGLYPAEDLYPYEDLYPSEFGGDGEPVENVDYYKDMQYEDYLVDGISGLTIRQEEGDVGANVGEGDNPYIIEGNFLVYGKSAADLLNIAQSLLPYISGRIYRPAQIECYAMPWLEVGDAVRVPTRDDIVETFAMKRTMKGCQAMMDTIESTGSKQREEVFGINKKIIQLEGKSAVITQTVEEVSARVTDLKEYAEAQFKITAESIEAEVKKREDGDAELSGRITVNADKIESEVKRLDGVDASFETRITQTEKDITLKVSVGDVTKQLNSELKITGNSIELTTGHFTVNAENLTIDSQGNATFSGKLSAASGSFSGNITVSNISGTTITGGTVSGASITGGIINIGNKLFYAYGDDENSYDGAYVLIGGFECYNLRQGSSARYIFQSSDGYTGISARPPGSAVERDLIWAGYSSASGSSLFSVNTNGSVHSEGNVHCVVVDCSRITASGSITGGQLNDNSCTTADGYTVGGYLDWLYWQMNQLSDRSVKTNIENIVPEEALEFLCRHTPITFQYTTDGLWSDGFIAQDVEALEDEMEIYYPLLSTDRVTNKYTIKYMNYIPLLVAAIQNLQGQIDELKGGDMAQ